MKILSITLALMMSLFSAKNHAETEGAFLKSCSKVTLKGSTLNAICKNAKGKPGKTTLDLSKCITNSNGKLKRGAAYQKSSTGCSLKKGVLTCTKVKNTKGKEGKATINIDEFISNSNGTLKCDKVKKAKKGAKKSAKKLKKKAASKKK